MPELPGISDPDEVKRARKKLVAIRRAERRLRNRLEDIDWEYDSLLPELRSFEQQITVIGELPEFTIEEEKPAAKVRRKK